MAWIMRVSSDAFGVEEIKYDTFKEACLAAGRWAAAAAELNDEVSRTIDIDAAPEDRLCFKLKTIRGIGQVRF
jgi:hypothetical protein